MGSHAQIVGTNMFTTMQDRQPNRIKQEVRQIRQATKRIAASKETARRFLISTGIYRADGQLKSNFR